MQKNVAGQKWVVFAFNKTTGNAVTGDQANITANLRIDGGGADAIDSGNPTQLESGYYVFALSQAETNGNYIVICPTTTTANTQVIGCPAAVFTRPPNFQALGIQAGGAITTLNGHTPQTGDSYAIVNDGTYGNSALNTNIGTVNTAVGVVDTVVGNINTSLTDAKGATFDTTTDSLEAIRNRGDAAWITGGGLTGSYTVVITIKDNTGATVPAVAVEVWNSDGSTFYEKQFTNSAGQVTFSMDAGIYIIKSNKIGYSWSNVTQTITANASLTYTGTIFSITPPTEPSLCRIYTFLKNNDGSVPSTVSRSLKVVAIPFDITNYYYSGIEIDGIYNTTTGLLYWDVVRGATVKIKIAGYGIDGNKITVPDEETKALTDLI